jgi:hypothetical protein
VATNCCVLATAIDGVDGDNVTVVKVGPMKKFLQPAITSTPSASKPKKDAALHVDFRFISTTAIPPTL